MGWFILFGACSPGANSGMDATVDAGVDVARADASADVDAGPLVPLPDAIGSDAVAPDATGGLVTASCTSSIAGVLGCIEYGNYAPEALVAPQAACATGTWALSGCSHAGAAGACRMNASSGPGYVASWYYTPTYTSDVVMTVCAASSLTYVAP